MQNAESGICVYLCPSVDNRGGFVDFVYCAMPSSLNRQELRWNLNLLTEDTGFAFTTKQAGAMRDHLARLLHHTRLKAIQWINVNRHLAEFTTLAKSKS